MKPRFCQFITLCLGLLMLNACSVKRLAVGQVGGMVQDGLPAFYAERDLHLAETALASNIKLLETLLVSSPNDQTLLLVLAQGMTAYSFGFVETEFERFKFLDPKRADEARLRAQGFYIRAKNYALRALKEVDPKFAAALDLPPNEFKPHLKRISKREIPYLFWYAFAWGGEINLSKDSITAISGIVYVEEMMRHILVQNPDYFFGGADLFLGVYFASRPKMFGGNPVTAKKHFSAVDRINKNQYLLSKVFEAQYNATQSLDEDKFKALLQEVVDADLEKAPEMRLMNEIAVSRAQILKANAHELF